MNKLLKDIVLASVLYLVFAGCVVKVIEHYMTHEVAQTTGHKPHKHRFIRPNLA